MMMILLNPCLFCPVWGISYARLSNVAAEVKLSAFLNCKSGAISHITTTILFFPIITRRATYQPVTQEYQNLKDKKIFCYLETRQKQSRNTLFLYTTGIFHREGIVYNTVSFYKLNSVPTFRVGISVDTYHSACKNTKERTPIF